MDRNDKSSSGVYSPSKMAFHKGKLEALARGEVTAPLYVRVKPTNKCNHHCFYCSYDPEFGYVLSETLNPQDEMPPEKMKELLADFRDMSVKAVTFSGGGEPLLYPTIVDAMSRALDYGIDLSIITNGQALQGERAEILSNSSWVRVSADSINSEMFERIRRVPQRLFGQLEKNLRKFAEMKGSDCEFGINFVINEHNAYHVFAAAQHFKDIGADHIKFSPLYTPRGFMDYHAPFREVVSDQISKAQLELQDGKFIVHSTYDQDFDLACVSERMYPRCFMMEIVPVVAADSNVYFCHDKAYSEGGKLGSIAEQSFKDLWFSPQTAKIFAKFDPVQRCRHHCTADCRNLETQAMLGDMDNLDEYKPSSRRHDNFI